MTVQALAPRDVESTLNYYTPLDSQPPYYYVDDPPAGVPKTNVGQGTHPVVIHDARGKGDAQGLDVSGFQFVHYPSAEKDFADEGKIKSAYYAEVEDSPQKHSVHADQTPAAAAQRVELHLGDEAERLLKGRYRIINVWSVKYNPGHKWYYLSDQTPDEVTLIKCFDSDVDKARLTPHSAFHDSTSPPDAPQRQSIEVRALVFDTE
ncbi:hypothetical protein EV363DRAFT_1416121 [Boletus edulis]|nr:hypothetical protein EV363DRAFT_1416121 [Boletus edulis]